MSGDSPSPRGRGKRRGRACEYEMKWKLSDSPDLARRHAKPSSLDSLTSHWKLDKGNGMKAPTSPLATPPASRSGPPSPMGGPFNASTYSAKNLPPSFLSSAVPQTDGGGNPLPTGNKNNFVIASAVPTRPSRSFSEPPIPQPFFMSPMASPPQRPEVCYSSAQQQQQQQQKQQQQQRYRSQSVSSPLSPLATATAPTPASSPSVHHHSSAPPPPGCQSFRGFSFPTITLPPISIEMTPQNSPHPEQSHKRSPGVPETEMRSVFPHPANGNQFSSVRWRSNSSPPLPSNLNSDHYDNFVNTSSHDIPNTMDIEASGLGLQNTRVRSHSNPIPPNLEKMNQAQGSHFEELAQSTAHTTVVESGGGHKSKMDICFLVTNP